MNLKLSRTVFIFWIFLCLLPLSCSDQEMASPGDQRNFRPGDLKDNPLMQKFLSGRPNHSVLKYARADLTNDGQEDLIVIFKIEKEKNMMCILYRQGASVFETNAVPAPVSDQRIEFRNIDEKPPLEFVLQGRKGGKVGYAIFRIEEGILTDLFGEGMEDCC